ncbi:MAG: hypothetical protein JW741_10595 [Sedimentisphaerales bacterium]|nr:hypothetical protein [Sedimentisphaerales bacterium]
MLVCRVWEGVRARPKGLIRSIGLVPVLLVMALAGGLRAASEAGIPSYSDLKADIETACESRSALLQHSTGRARLSMEQTKTPWQGAERLSKRFLEGLGVDPTGLTPLSATGQWSVTWYRKGPKNRYDVSAGPVVDGGDSLSLFLPTNMRVASDPAQAPCTVHYDVPANRVYLRPGSVPLHDSFGLFRCFDISRLYKFDGRTVPELLAGFDKAKVVPELSADRIEGMRCIKMEFNIPRTPDPGARRRRRTELWVAPEMSFSLVRARFRDNGPTALKDVTLIESYDAVYEESKRFDGVWLLKHLRTVDHRYSTPGGIHNVDHDASKRLEVTIESTELDVAIPDATFTLEGLGVSPDTRIYDASLAGHPLTYYHKFVW